MKGLEFGAKPCSSFRFLTRSKIAFMSSGHMCLAASTLIKESYRLSKAGHFSLFHVPFMFEAGVRLLTGSLPLPSQRGGPGAPLVGLSLPGGTGLSLSGRPLHSFEPVNTIAPP